MKIHIDEGRCVLKVVEVLKKALRGQVKVFCLGNKLRKDDGVGSYVAEKLSDLGELVIDAELSLENYAREISQVDTALLIDAVNFGSEPGDLLICELSEAKEDLFSFLIFPTHRMPLYLLRRVSRETDLVLAGVQPADTDFGTGLSNRVRMGADVLVEAIRRVLAVR